MTHPTFVSVCFLLVLSPFAAFSQGNVLSSRQFEHYINAFNREDQELYKQYYPNRDAWKFLKENIPLFECPDKELEKTYYFRWWTYRKHIRETPAGFVITEFLPSVPWAGEYNTISCAAGHHFYEGRWLHDPSYLEDYMQFWLDEAGNDIRKYSFWSANAWKAFLSVHPEAEVPAVLQKLTANYKAWENTHGEPIHGLFWQTDGADGMEVSVGGQLSNGGEQVHGYKGIRPTINSYMYGDAQAIAALAVRQGLDSIAADYRARAAHIKKATQKLLWSDSLGFFGSVALDKNSGKPPVLPVRELTGYVPWYFNLPDDNAGYGQAWKHLLDTNGFKAPYGPTTCERRHPCFAVSYQGHECQWNGPSWPYATAQTLTAMANVLNNYRHTSLAAADYHELLSVYSESHRRTTADGRKIPWIDENLDPFTGEWLARARLESWPGEPWPDSKGGLERGKDYNHSTFCDLIISGLIGLRPQLADSITVNPLVPEEEWDYFCLDNVLCHGRILTILYDKTGKKYRKGKGFRIFIDGKNVHSSPGIEKVTLSL